MTQDVTWDLISLRVSVSLGCPICGLYEALLSWDRTMESYYPTDTRMGKLSHILAISLERSSTFYQRQEILSSSALE